MPITVNVAGQVGQIRLPTSKALWPLFETVINSIQSLEESDTKKKVIVIDALRPEHTQLKTGEQGRTIIEEQAHFEAFTVTDNGNGFNSQNHQSFLEAYSQLKVKKGCKGIGRFLWLKAFDKVTVDSIYYEGNSGTMYFMVAGDLLNPLDSIGFFKDVAMGSGRSGLQLVRSSQSLTVFSWLIPVNLCVAQFASELRARTDELFVSHGGRLSTLYRAKFGVVCGFCLLLQLAFYGICITITAIQMGIAPALGTVLLFCAVSVGNLLVLGAFLALASVLTLWMKNHAAAALVTSILPLAGVLLYQVQYEDFSTQPLLIQLAAKAMPTYYWSRLCALNITPQFCVELVAWVIVALAVAEGLGWMALHRPDAGKQRSARKAHAVLRRREKSAARQGMHRASTFSAALYALRCTRLPGMLALFGLLCMAFALEVSESRIVDATWADGRRVGIFPGGSLPVGSAADAALGTVLSVGILAWIAVILVAVMAFHQNKTAGAARLAVAYGVSRVRYMVGSFAAETIMLQGWYMVLYFLLSVVTGSLSQPGRTAFFWMQSAWILQASYAVVWLVCRLCGSELAGATFCFVVTLAGVIVSVSAPDPAAVSPLSALLFYATPMPYWLALGGGHSIPWQAVGYGAGVTALCLAAALAITTVRDVE